MFAFRSFSTDENLKQKLNFSREKKAYPRGPIQFDQTQQKTAQPNQTTNSEDEQARRNARSYALVVLVLGTGILSYLNYRFISS